MALLNPLVWNLCHWTLFSVSHRTVSKEGIQELKILKSARYCELGLRKCFQNGTSSSQSEELKLQKTNVVIFQGTASKSQKFQSEGLFLLGTSSGANEIIKNVKLCVCVCGRFTALISDF